MPSSTPTELEGEIAARKSHLARVEKMRIALAKETLVATENLCEIANDEQVKPDLRVRAADKILTYQEKFETFEADTRVHNLKVLNGMERPRIGKYALTATERTLRLLLEMLLQNLTETALIAIETLTEMSSADNIYPAVRIRASEKLLAYHARLCKGERSEAFLRHTEELFDEKRQAAPFDDPIRQKPANPSTDSIPQQSGTAECERWSLRG